MTRYAENTGGPEMIDTEKMRADHGTYHHVPDDQVPHCNLPIEECRRCAVDALCDENDELRREVERLSNDPWKQLELHLYRQQSKYLDEAEKADSVKARDRAFELLVLSGRVCSQRQEIARLHREVERLRGKEVGCERNDGTLNVHRENETCEVCEPDWLPAPDTMPEELASAQMVEVQRRSDGQGFTKMPAAVVSWALCSKYRPLYSDSGLPLCSSEGLEEWARFVATSDGGMTMQFSRRPWAPKREGSWLYSGKIGEALKSHRKPGDWRDSLMEAMR